MATVALDLGQRRIGIAVTDAAGIAAHPLGVVERRSLKRDLEALAAMLRDRDVTTLIVGLPLNMDGSEGAGARSARRFAEQLTQTLGTTVEMFDERLTSFEAEERLKGTSVRRGSKKAAIDAVAAVVILETWLQSRSQKNAG